MIFATISRNHSEIATRPNNSRHPIQSVTTVWYVLNLWGNWSQFIQFCGVSNIYSKTGKRWHFKTMSAALTENSAQWNEPPLNFINWLTFDGLTDYLFVLWLVINLTGNRHHKHICASEPISGVWFWGRSSRTVEKPSPNTIELQIPRKVHHSEWTWSQTIHGPRCSTAFVPSASAQEQSAVSKLVQTSSEISTIGLRLSVSNTQFPFTTLRDRHWTVWIRLGQRVFGRILRGPWE